MSPFPTAQKPPPAFTVLQLREHCAFAFAKPRGQNAFTWRERYRAFTAKQRGRSTERSCRAVVSNEGGFTLLELLVVTTIIILLLAAVMPAVNSLSKSN